MSGFGPEVLLALSGARTARLETSAAPGRSMRSVTVWVVVDDARRVLVRSWQGERGRWYRDLRANPRGVLRVAGQRVPFVAELADDAERIEACSHGLRAKYVGARGSLEEMLVDEVLPTTLELKPA
ncbi:MAG: nitroreductase/quinone reductase family protein [Candidatus Limnocylindria bacterium]